MHFGVFNISCAFITDIGHCKKINEFVNKKLDTFEHKEGPDFSLYPKAVTNPEVLPNEDAVGISNGNTMSAPSSAEPTNVQVAVTHCGVDTVELSHDEISVTTTLGQNNFAEWQIVSIRPYF